MDRLKAKRTLTEVTDYFLLKDDTTMTPKKMYNLIYLAFGYSLVCWNDSIEKEDVHSLFKGSFQAWINAPRNPTLYSRFKRRQYKVLTSEKAIEVEWTQEELELLEAIWERYGKCDGFQLDEQLRKDKAWIETRGTLRRFQDSERVIPLNLIFESFKTYEPLCIKS